MTHYAVIQKGYAVFGTGTSKEEALEDCKEWIDKDDPKQEWDVDDFSTSYNSINEGEFVIVEATKELCEQAQKEPSVVYVVESNIADTFERFWGAKTNQSSPKNRRFFGATTNQSKTLEDQTGSRRFWIAK